MNGFKKQTTKIFGSEVAYWTNQPHPDNPTIVMVHGFTGSHQGFFRIVPYLSDKFNLIIPDLPGFGISPLPHLPFGIDEQVDYLNEFVRQLTQSKPYILGHSYGGLLVARLIAKYPDITNRLVLITPPIVSRNRLKMVNAGAILGNYYYRLVEAWPNESLAKNKIISRVLTNAIKHSRDPEMSMLIHREHINNLNYISSRKFYRQLYDEINHASVSQIQDGLSDHQVLLILADKDKVVVHSERNKIDNNLIEIRTIQNAGHLLHYERPQEVAELVTSFLK